MNLNQADILSRLRRFLDRRQSPRRVEGKPQAEADEVTALAAAVGRYAPRDADKLAAWWPKFEARLGETGTGLWPTEREIRDCATEINKSNPTVKAEARLDPHEIAARKMAAGEPVGEGYLYGADAVEMIRRHLVDRETMTRYRSAAYHNRRTAHGEPSALEWEAEAKSRHEAAKAVALDKSEPQQRDGRPPDMTSPARGFYA